MRGSGEYVVRPPDNSAPCRRIHISVTKEGGPARGGAIHEKQGEFWNLPGFRVFSIFPPQCKPRFGAISQRTEFSANGAACGDSRDKTGSRRGCKQGDAD